ncbi:MAG TPA: hypothetical protein VF743_05980, partial [Acidimicrobiales bacterium]
LVAVAVYARTRSSVPALTHDALDNLLAIEGGGAALYHPHHLAFGAVSWVWLRLLRAAGVDGDPLLDVALLNSVLGGVCVALAHVLLRVRAALPAPLALAGAAGAGLSFGVWFYSGNVEVYVLPLALLLAALLAATAPRPTAWTATAAGALHGLAVLGHQVHVLFAAVLLVALVRRGADRGQLARYLGTAAAVVVAGYGLVLGLVVRPSSPGAAVDWATSYAQERSYWYPPGRSTLPDAAIGFGRAVIGGHFAFRLDNVREQVVGRFPGKSLADEAFLVRRLDAAGTVVLLAAALVAAALLVGVLVTGARRLRTLPAPARGLVPPLVTLLGVYGLVFLFWEPWNPEFWIPQATALWLLAATLSAPRVRAGPGGRRLDRPAAALAASAVLVGVVNLAGSIVPATDPGNDVYAVRYGALAPLVGPGDLVVVDRPHLGVGYATRLTDATPVPATTFSTSVDPDRPAPADLPDDVLARVDRALADGHRVAVDPELVTRPSNPEAARTGRELRVAHGDRWRAVRADNGVRWLVIDPPDQPPARKL